jgi:hypothetical protein
MTTPTCVSGNDDALHGVLKTSDDDERVSRELDIRRSSNTQQICTIQEANCCVDSNTRASKRRTQQSLQ